MAMIRMGTFSHSRFEGEKLERNANAANFTL